MESLKKARAIRRALSPDIKKSDSFRNGEELTRKRQRKFEEHLRQNENYKSRIIIFDNQRCVTIFIVGQPVLPFVEATLS